MVGNEGDRIPIRTCPKVFYCFYTTAIGGGEGGGEQIVPGITCIIAAILQICPHLPLFLYSFVAHMFCSWLTQSFVFLYLCKLCLTPKEPYGGQTPGFPGGGGGMEEDGGKRPSAPRFSPGMRCVCCWRWTEMKHEHRRKPHIYSTVEKSSPFNSLWFVGKWDTYNETRWFIVTCANIHLNAIYNRVCIIILPGQYFVWPLLFFNTTYTLLDKLVVLISSVQK